MVPNWKPATDEEILAQIPAALAAERRSADMEPRAVHAWYDSSAHRVMVELADGCLFGFPPEAEPEIEGFPADVLERVRVLPGGGGLTWDDTDAAISVPGLLRGEHVGEAGREAAAFWGDAAPETGTPNARADAAEVGELIEQAIGMLRPEYRTAIVLRDMDGREVEDIAEVMGLPLGTVRNYIHRGRNELRGYLAHLHV
jgi:RNA polymerase sigma factor (sigma-70 family)